MDTQTIELTPSIGLGVGWHPEMAAEDYHALELPSSSLLSRVRQSPAHARAWLDSEHEQTKAMRVGSAFHCDVLEPVLFDKLYVVQPEFSGTGSVAARAAWKEANASRTILTAEEYFCALGMGTAVRTHPTARKLLAAATHRELTGIFREQTTGELCKVRIDALVPSFNATIDLKSCADASPQGFRWQAVKYGMHRQGAIYADACEALGEKAEHHIIIAVENKAPYAVGIYRISDGDMQRGRREYIELLKVWSDCCANQFYPGYSEHIEELALPLGTHNDDITMEDLI